MLDYETIRKDAAATLLELRQIWGQVTMNDVSRAINARFTSVGHPKFKGDLVKIAQQLSAQTTV